MKHSPLDHIYSLAGSLTARTEMQYLICLISALILWPGMTSCEKELDFKYHDIPPLTVIEAQMTPEKTECAVTLTVPMDSPLSEAPRLTDATVTLTDLTAGETFILHPDSDGLFTSACTGVTGHDYRLSVEHDGLRHSAETRMYPSVDIISSEFAWIRMPYDDVAVLQCRYRSGYYAQGDEEYYWVKVYRNGEIYLWSEQSSRTADDGIMTFMAMTSRRDLDAEDEKSALHDGDMIMVSISRISREMHDYLEAISNDSNGPAMFTTTALSAEYPGEPQRCLGYFIAASPTSVTLTFHPDSIPYATPE